MSKKVFEIGYECRNEDFHEFAKENNMEDIDLEIELNESFCKVLDSDEFVFENSYADTFSGGYGQGFYQKYIVRSNLTIDDIYSKFRFIEENYNFYSFELIITEIE